MHQHLNHAWDVSPKEAIKIQREFALLVENKSSDKLINLVAGLDVAFSDHGKSCIAGVVLWDIAQGAVVEQHVIKTPVRFPYIPGLLSFREAPALLSVLKKLKQTPDMLMCDGQGIAHPRRFGIAAHLGILTQIMSVGCAKSRLCGEHRPPGLKRGNKTQLTHKNEKIGLVLRTKHNTKPIFVSIGHRIDLKTAEQIVLRCVKGYRLPEPTRLADRLVAKAKKDELISK